jgi:hypothetical protein
VSRSGISASRVAAAQSSDATEEPSDPIAIVKKAILKLSIRATTVEETFQDLVAIIRQTGQAASSPQERLTDVLSSLGMVVDATGHRGQDMHSCFTGSTGAFLSVYLLVQC